MEHFKSTHRANFCVRFLADSIMVEQTLKSHMTMPSSFSIHPPPLLSTTTTLDKLKISRINSCVPFKKKTAPKSHMAHAPLNCTEMTLHTQMSHALPEGVSPLGQGSVRTACLNPQKQTSRSLRNSM